MQIKMTAAELHDTNSCRLKSVAAVLTERLDRAVWVTAYGLWVTGLNGNGLILWDTTSRQQLTIFLEGRSEELEVHIPERLLKQAYPRTSLTEQAEDAR